MGSSGNDALQWNQQRLGKLVRIEVNLAPEPPEIITLTIASVWSVQAAPVRSAAKSTCDD